MNDSLLVAALALALSVTASHSQTTKPLTEADLLKTFDSAPAESLNTKAGVNDDASLTPKKEKTGDQTEITADAADFNNKTHIAIFIGHVIVKNPEFNVVCDKLTAYLKHEEKPAAATGEKKVAEPTVPKSKGGLERAIAEMQDGGKVIITQDKKEVDGSITHSIGKSERAVYNAITGEITLTGWPDVKQGINSSVAVDEDTQMIMTRDGKMRTKGRATFLIQDTGNDKPAAH